MCQQVKEQMFEYYEQHSQGMEASITDLSEVAGEKQSVQYGATGSQSNSGRHQ